jgi:hypothetical protein
MTSTGLRANRYLYVFADHGSDSYVHNQVQTCADRVPTCKAADKQTPDERPTDSVMCPQNERISQVTRRKHRKNVHGK